MINKGFQLGHISCMSLPSHARAIKRCIEMKFNTPLLVLILAYDGIVVCSYLQSIPPSGYSGPLELISFASNVRKATCFSLFCVMCFTVLYSIATAWPMAVAIVLPPRGSDATFSVTTAA